MIIGTSSTRRVAYLRHHYPHLQIVDMRGNLQTRIQKMRDGVCEALLLAYAGVARMGYADMIVHTFALDHFTPAVGQGSLAIECHQSLDAGLKNTLRTVLGHPATSVCLRAERAYLAEMNGGCSIPVYGYAHIESGEVLLEAGIIDLAGQEHIREQMSGPDPDALGREMGKKILSLGGERILNKIRTQLK